MFRSQSSSVSRRPFRTRLLVLGLLASCSFAPGCEDRRGGDAEVFPDVGGEVVSIAAARRRFTVAHEAIPGFMEAMTMPLEVEDPALLEGVRPGDRIRFTLRRMDGRVAVQSLRVVAPAGAAATASPAAQGGLLGEKP